MTHQSKPLPGNEGAAPLSPDNASGANDHSQEKAADDSAAYGQNDPFREIGLVWLAVLLIDSAPRRLRRAMQNQEEAVLRAIERFGFRIPILVRSKPGGERYEVIDGHTRLIAARRLNAEKVPCILVDDLPDVEVRRLALSLNKLQETATWDEENVRLEIEEIIEIGGDIEIPGFEIPEIEAIRFGSSPAEGEDAADDVSHLIASKAVPVARPGDTFLLRDHRLHCGSARDTASLAALFEGQLVDAVFVDAPYNLKVNGFLRSTAARFAEFAEGSGEMTREEFIIFLAETLGNAVAQLKPGGILFACMDWRHVSEMTVALQILKLELLNICVWVKSNPGMGGLYRNQHEFVFVAKRQGGRHKNNVQLGKFGRNRTNVWTYAGATGGRRDADDDFGLHPTVKPIRMVMDALLDVTAPGDLVVDTFLGSGTTLLAAERTRRRCIGVEIEPVYVDLAIRRWQEMTGEQAIHAASSKTFDDLAEERARDIPPAPSAIEEDF